VARKRWIKLWTQETLYGTTSRELELAERAIWHGFLALAGDSIEPGKIEVAPNIPWTDEQLARVLNAPMEILLSAKQKMIKYGKIKVNGNIIVVNNWERYQSEYERTKRYDKSTLKPTTKSSVEKTVENLSTITEGKGGEDLLNKYPNVYLFRLQDLLAEINQREKKGEKLGLLVEEFSFHHQKAPPEDFENLGGRVAGLLKQVSNDYGYLAKIIWDTSSANIAGSHLNYIQGRLRKDKSKRDIQDLPSEEEIKQSVKEFKGG